VKRGGEAHSKKKMPKTTKQILGGGVGSPKGEKTLNAPLRKGKPLRENTAGTITQRDPGELLFFSSLFLST